MLALEVHGAGGGLKRFVGAPWISIDYVVLLRAQGRALTEHLVDCVALFGFRFAVLA
jgi:hypothetical protein